MEKQDTKIELTEERVREIVREEILRVHDELSSTMFQARLGEQEASHAPSSV